MITPKNIKAFSVGSEGDIVANFNDRYFNLDGDVRAVDLDIINLKTDIISSTVTLASSDLTIVVGDGIEYVEVDCTSNNVNINLPLQSANLQREISIKVIKQTGSYQCIVNPNVTDANTLSSDALNVIWLPKIGNSLKVKQSSNSGKWEFLSEQITSQLRLTAYAGYGSTDNKIMRFTNVVENVGNIFSENHVSGYSGNAKGLELTIQRSGKYQGVFNLRSGDSFYDTYGISLNSNQLTVTLGFINVSNIIAIGEPAGVSNAGFIPFTVSMYLKKGDVVRPHTGGYAPMLGAVCNMIFSYIGQ